jgi:hypothetical protein
MEHQGSLMHSQDPATCPYSEPNRSSARTQLLKSPTNYTYTCLISQILLYHVAAFDFNNSSHALL